MVNRRSQFTHKRMKKILWESEAVPTVSKNFGYFLNTKFMLFYRRNIKYFSFFITLIIRSLHNTSSVN